MRKLLTIFLLLISVLAYSQTNATFKNLDVRETSKLRGLIYPFGASAKTPLSTSDEVLMVELPSFKLVRVDFSEFADSITSAMVGLWYLDGDTIINISDYKVRMTDEVYIYPLPPEATKTGRMMHINQYGQVEWMSPATLVDTLQILMPQYWTFVDSGTDTLKNNVATSGVVAIKGNLELETTNAAATNGIVKQNGVNLIHTYHEKGDNNLFIGQGAGNFTADSSFNIGIGKDALKSLTSGYKNIAIGTTPGDALTTGYENTAIGYNALGAATGSVYNVAIGVNAGEKLTSTGNVLIGNNAGTNLYTNGYNVGIGHNSLVGSATTSADRNVAIGNDAGKIITTAEYNVFIGSGSGDAVTTADRNVFVGQSSGGNTSTGSQNVFIGDGAASANVANRNTVAIGYNVMLYANSTSSGAETFNTAIGYEAMRGSTTAANNTGKYNTAVGYQALDAMTSCDSNTVVGHNAGGAITTGDNNIFIGAGAGATYTTESNLIVIGNATNNLLYPNTYWDDMNTPSTAARIGINDKPVFDYDTLALLWDNTPVDTSTQYIVLNYQLPHRWKPGTDLYLHVHYLQHSASDTCEFFKATYKWTDMGETRAGAYTMTKTTNQTVYAYTSNTLHQIAAFPAISGSGHTESSVLQIILYCYSDADLYSLDTDIHYEIDKPGGYEKP